MKINTINIPVKCDTVLCNKNATVCIETNSFKGNTFLCEKCLKEMQNLLKRNTSKNETKE